MYYSDETPGYISHTVSAINNNDHVIVPFRNPKDSIASWHSFPSNGTLEDDIKFYLRFSKAALDNINKVTLMDFDKFTSSIEYIQKVIKKSIGLNPISFSTSDQIKNDMTKDKRGVGEYHYWLPSNNKEQLNSIKNVLVEKDGFEECLSVYTDLKRLSDSFNI